MRLRLLAFTLLGVCALTAGWAKEKLDPQALMAKSDAQYYYPAAHGVTDLAVEIVIEQLAKSPLAKDVRITYYYAGDDRQRIDVTGIGEKDKQLRGDILALVAPLGDYLMPRTSAANFAGLTLSASSITREIAGHTGTDFFQLVGAAKDEQAEIKEYRVLLDTEGLAHQVESVLKNGGTMMARVENTRVGDAWHVSKVVTRLLAESGPQWKIDTVDYAPVDTFTLPSKVTTQYRNAFNQPISGVTDWNFQFKNYRINKGAGAAAFAQEPAKTEAK